MRILSISLSMICALLVWPAAAQQKLGTDPAAPGPFSIVPRSDRPDLGMDDHQRFDWHGYFRTSLTMGMNQRSASGAGQSPTVFHLDAGTFHSPEVFGAWTATNSMPASWASIIFTAGTPKVSAVIGLGAWNHTTLWGTPEQTRYAQNAISITPAFISVRENNLFGRKIRLQSNWGAVGGRYGATGKSDMGKYGALVIAGAGSLGEITSLEMDHGDMTYRLEDGLGLGGYPADPNLGTTWLHHAHAFAGYKDKIRVGLHYLHAWTTDDRSAFNDPDGTMDIYGAEIRLDQGVLGDLYLGGSYARLKNAQHLGPVMGVAHANGAQGIKDNFLGLNPATGALSGSLVNVGFQYEYSLAKLLRSSHEFSGDGPDLKIALFGMYTGVQSENPDWDGKKKFKYGAEVTYNFLPWLSAGFRYDQVKPDLGNSDFDFTILSPRITLRSHFITHEDVSLVYGHYSYGAGYSPGYAGGRLFPRDDLVPAPLTTSKNPYDTNVFSISAQLWW